MYSEDDDSDDSQKPFTSFGRVKKSTFGSKKKPYQHKFCNEWTKKPEFSTWLLPSKKGIHFYHCKVCNDDNKGGIAAVIKHAKSMKHIRAINSIKNVKAIDQMPTTIRSESIKKKVKTSEIRLAMFIVEHNIALSTSDHLIQLIKSICPESEIVNKISCNRTKATSIVCNVIGKYDNEERYKRMKNQHFSIMIDESTDHSSIKHLAIVTRLFDTENFEIRDEFFDLIKIANATTQNIYDAIVQLFNQHNIPYKENLVGFASDGANVMFGANNSVKKLLENDVPDLFVMKCLCHSLALCASYSCENIPNEVEDMIKAIYTYMKHSYKRQESFKEFQVFVEAKPHKLLQPNQVRWLSLHASVKRILEQYKALKIFFQGEKLIDNKANQIFQQISNPMNEYYLYFLDFVLPIITKLNIEFQSEQPKIHCIYSRMEGVYRTLLEFYIKPDALKSDVSKIQYRNPINFLTSENIYLGGSCMAALSNGTIPQKEDFINVCLKFYVECCHQIYMRFPFNSNNIKALKLLKFLDPTNIKNIASVAPAVDYFKTKLNLDLNELDQEWRLLKNNNFDFNLPMLEFWKFIKSVKNGNDEEMYPIINRVVNYILLLPHSSAAVERVFSTININKTKIRNRLNTETLSGLLSSKNILKNKKCYDFPVEEGMLQKHDNSMYK